MNILFTVFIDSLKPESVSYMPFLNSLNVKRRMRTEPGYSITCKSTIYSGVHPDKHLVWFVGKYSPDTSPFKWIKRTEIHKLPHCKYTKAACYMITKFLNRKHKMDYWGLWREPMKNWFYFDTVEDNEAIFGILESNGVEHETISEIDDLHKVLGKYDLKSTNLWLNMFIGDIDPLTHQYGQDSDISRRRLEEIDSGLERGYRLLEKEAGNFYFLCFSDHGQSKVEGRVNLASYFAASGMVLDEYVHFVDSNYARFWFRNAKEREEVEEVLSRLSNEGFILTEQHLRKYHIHMPDNRYGDLIFYLKPPYIFELQGLTLLGRSFTGHDNFMHGFLPDHPESDGVLISNKDLVECSYVELVDIFPSILTIFGIEVPAYADGKALWK